MIDTDAIKEHIRGILVALGDDPDREGLKETPDRVARMYEEVFEGMNYTNHEIAKMFNKTFNEDAGTAKGSDEEFPHPAQTKPPFPKQNSKQKGRRTASPAFPSLHKEAF